MITVTNRQYKIITQINYFSNKGLVVLEDEFSQPEDSLLSQYNFSFIRSTPEASQVSVGCFIFAQDGENIRCFEIMETQDENDIRTVYCIDAGLDLINEEKGPIDEQVSQSLVYYVNNILFDSGWEIGHNTIPNIRTRKLSYDSSESSVKRLQKIAKEFNADVQFQYIIDDYSIVKRVVNLLEHEENNRQRIVLEYGLDISNITKTENIYNLATAIYSVGEENITLHHYTVPREDFDEWVIYDGVLIHKPSTKIWSRHQHNVNGYILARYESTAKTIDRLYQETKRQILKRNVPEVTFDIEVSKLPEKIRRGDKVSIIAHDYNPDITIEATVSAVEKVSFVDETFGIVKVTNVTKLETLSIEQEIEFLKTRFNTQISNWNNAPNVMTIIASNGTIFQNGNISTTLTATITKNNIDITNTFTRFVWQRVSRYDTTKDIDFNREGVSISITKDDVDIEARFICQAYQYNEMVVQADIVIKDFVMTTYKGKTAPQNVDGGTLWVDTSENKEITKIYDNGKWVPIVNDITIDDIQNGLENHLAPIREKQQMLEAELQAKVIKNVADKMQEEFKKLVEVVDNDKKIDAEKLLNLMERLSLQETNFGKFKNQWNFLDGYITFSNEGMYIGSKESSTSILVANGGITIFSNGSEVASFKEGYMKIDNGIFTRSVQVGTKWRVQPYRTNDDILAFIYLGVIEIV